MFLYIYYFYLVFSRENNAWSFNQIVCQADDLHEMPSLIFSEKYEVCP